MGSGAGRYDSVVAFGGSIIAVSLTLVLIAGVLALAAVAWRVQQSRSTRNEPATAPVAPPHAESQTPDAHPTSRETIDGLFDECLRLAFGVARLDYQILGEHAVVLKRVEETLTEAIHERDYFPRRPKLLPRIQQLLNDDESSRRALVQLILEDPTLAAGVLKLANSAFYRVSPEPVETLHRAVILLGTDGLRSLLATAILQPVFRLPKGFFDDFAPSTWEQAQRTAAAAETCAKREGGCDPFVAQLLGLLSALARLVIFRLTLDRYRERPNILPRAEVFTRAMRDHGSHLARLIAESWELSEASLVAMRERQPDAAPESLSPLGRALYFGELCGALALLHKRGAYSADGAHAMLIGQGLRRETVFAAWHAACAER